MPLILISWLSTKTVPTFEAETLTQLPGSDTFITMKRSALDDFIDFDVD